MKNFVQIGDVKYKIPQSKLAQLQDFLDSEQIKEYDLEREYRGLVCRVTSKVACQMRISLSKIPEAHHEVVKSLLVQQAPKDIEEALESLREHSEGSVSVPKALIPLAEYRTSTSSGSQVGRGELAIPFMFSDAYVNEGGNALYDVSISNVGWHVKNGNPESGIRMGSAKTKLFSATEIYKELIWEGAEPTDFNELNQGLLRSSLRDWSVMLCMSESELYEKMSKQAVNTSVGDAAGIVWYKDGVLTFTEKSDLSLDSTTQFRSKLSTNGRNKILKK